jgi:hypothetical protein
MWTDITRRKHAREGLRYSSDLTDAVWAVLEPHIPPRSPTARRASSLPFEPASLGCDTCSPMAATPVKNSRPRSRGKASGELDPIRGTTSRLN